MCLLCTVGERVEETFDRIQPFAPQSRDRTPSKLSLTKSSHSHVDSAAWEMMRMVNRKQLRDFPFICYFRLYSDVNSWNERQGIGQR